METPFQKPVVCPVLIDRVDELATLNSLIDQANNGRGQVLLLSGEAGVGKSRLVTETKAYAVAQNFLLLQGNCFSSDISSPYAPLLDLLRSSAANQLATSITSDLAPFARELHQILPDVVPLHDQDLISPPDPEQEKHRLFTALIQFFTLQSTIQPVLFLIEDIHWSDDTSLEFLHQLARRCPTHALLILLTYRSDEVHSDLRHFLAQFDRERLAQEISLSHLTRDNVNAMLRAIFVLPHSAHNELSDLIYTLTEGNPFFVEEVLKSLITAGDIFYVNGHWDRKSLGELHIPRSVKDAVQQRTDLLSEDARRVLSLAAVIGRRFDFALLQELTLQEESQLLSLVKELITAQLVVEESADQFAFRHALTRQAIYAELLVRERQALHRTLAETLEQLSSSPSLRERYLGDLAAHCYEAGLWEKALLYSQAMGEHALTLYAKRAAIDHLTRAVNAAHHLSLTPPPQVYLARGQAYETLGDFERALGDFERALDVAHMAHDGNMEWQSVMALGYLWAARDYEQAGAWFQQALELAVRLSDPTLRARSLNRLGNWLENTGRSEEGLRAHKEALSIFETQQDTRGMAETFDLLGTAYGLEGDRINSVQQLGQAIELFRALKDYQSLTSSLAMRAIQSSSDTCETTFHSLRTRDNCLQDAEEALNLARQIDSHSGQAFAEMAQSYVHTTFGEFVLAIRHAQEALRIATAIEHQQWMAVAYCGLGDNYLQLLQPALARAVLENGISLARELGSAFLIGILTALQGLAYVLEHNLPQAVAALDTVMPREQLPQNLAERQIAWVWGELALAKGEASRALQRAELLLASAPGEQRMQAIPHLLKLKGEALVALSRFEEAVLTFEEGKRGAIARHDQSILWRIHRSAGQLFHRLQREDQAQLEYSAARHIIETLAASIDEIPLREHFLHAALASLPRVKPLSPQAKSRSAYDGLSNREREVAALVAQGRSNREIASHLVVSERTAEAHVSNILGKLGFTTRAQIASWAVEKGLSTTH